MKRKTINQNEPQVTNIRVPTEFFDIQSLAVDSWISFRKNNLIEGALMSVDELDSIATQFLFSIHKYGFNGIGTLDTVRDLLEQYYVDGKDIISFFEFIIRIAKDELDKKINIKFNEMSAHLKLKFNGERLISPNVVISSIRDFLNDNGLVFIEEREIKILSGGVCLKDDYFSYETEVFSLISDYVVGRVIVSPYTNILIEFFRDNSDIRHKNGQGESKVRLSPKKGPRNPELHSYIIKIVDATLLKNPNATTYALTEKLGAHLEEYRHNHPERKNWRISENQLRRWIKEHRELTGQDSQGKHDGNLKLEGVTY
ncbi:hypothetical protein [Klebsiella pneumoniae]|uniref:hypothetical protein n=1 Tax=Klebsiella pneumoniae TaxID=573 RepID=UPI00300E6481